MFGHHDAAPDTSGMPPGSYLLRRKLASIDGFLVFDSNGAQLYHFKHHAAFGKERWTMHDASEAQVAELVRPAMHVHPTFVLSRPGRADVTIRKSNFMPLKETWRIEGSEDGDLDVAGDIADHEFTVVDQSGRIVATATQSWITLTDSFGIQVDGVDPVLVIAGAVGIDVIDHEHR